MLSSLALVSSIRCLGLYDTSFQLERHDLIVAIAHTDETVPILREQLLRAFLARFEM